MSRTALVVFHPQRRMRLLQRLQHQRHVLDRALHHDERDTSLRAQLGKSWDEGRRIFFPRKCTCFLQGIFGTLTQSLHILLSASLPRRIEHPPCLFHTL